MDSEIKNVSEKYVSADAWNNELEKFVSQKKLDSPGKICISTKGIGEKLKKTLSHINLGLDITLAIPENFLFKNACFKKTDKGVQINVILEHGNG